MVITGQRQSYLTTLKIASTINDVMVSNPKEIIISFQLALK